MEKKNIDWGNLGFGYVQTDYRFVSDFKNGSWDEGKLTEDATVVINECAGVLQYAQTVFEGMKAYTTEDGRIVTFRPDLNAERMENSAKRLEMPVFPKDRFIQAVVDTVKANAAYVPPFGSGATLYIRPYTVSYTHLDVYKRQGQYRVNSSVRQSHHIKQGELIGLGNISEQPQIVHKINDCLTCLLYTSRCV